MGARTSTLAARSSRSKRGPTPSGARDAALRRLSVLDALPAHLALLDSLGTVVAINEPWRRFAAANGLDPPAGVGLNYLELCERASAGDPDGAGRVAPALREILNGQRDEFSLEYPCHSPLEQRWFRIEITKVYDDPLGNGALVLHHDITEKHLADAKAREAEQRYRAVFDLHFQFLAILSPQGEVIEINELALRVGGVRRDQIVGHPFWQTVWWTQLPGIQDWWGALLAAAAIAVEPLHRAGVYNTTSGETREVEMTLTAVRDESGAVAYFIAQGVDTTEMGHETRARHASEARLRAIVDGSPVPQLLVAREGMVTFVNPAFVQAFGYSREEARTLDDWWSRACPETAYREAIRGAWNVLMSRARHGVAAQPLEIAVRCKSGAEKTVLASPAPIDRASGGEHAVVIYDITDRKLAEETLRKQEIELSRINRALKMITGCNEALIRAADEGSLLQSVCEIAVDLGGYGRAGVGYAEEDEARTIVVKGQAGVPRDLMAGVPHTWASNQDGGSGPAARAIQSGQLVIVPDLSRETVLAPIVTRLREAGLCSGVFLPLKDVSRTFGVLTLYSPRKTPIGDQELTLLGELADDLAFGIASLRAHAERNAAEAALVASLREKEALLKEVHHRVKNNMQVITSLLRLEAHRVAHATTRGVLKDMQNRIQSMAALHETLYRSGNFAEVNLADYLKKLSGQLRRSQTARPGQIDFHLDLDPMTLDLDRAVPCGLIVNELVSNALKHAFPTGTSGSVWVGLHAIAPDSISLEVRDDGVGLPPDLDVTHPASLGLRMVLDLTRQISGTFSVAAGGSAAFSVMFPKPSAAGSSGQETSVR